MKASHAKAVNDIKCNMNQLMIYRAMKKAKDNILGKNEEEFGKVYLYANELKR